MRILPHAIGRFRTNVAAAAMLLVMATGTPASATEPIPTKPTPMNAFLAAQANDPWGEALAVRDVLVARINAERSVAGLKPLVYDWVLNEHAIASGADSKARCQSARDVRPPIAVHPGLKEQRMSDLQGRGYGAASTPVLDYDEAAAFLWRGAAARTGVHNANGLAVQARNTLFNEEASRLAGTPGMMLFAHLGPPTGYDVTHIAVAVETAWCAARGAQITIISVVTAAIGGAPRGLIAPSGARMISRP